MTCIALPLTFSMGYLSHEHMRWQPRMCSCCKTENGRHKKDNGSDTEPQSPTPTPPETLNPQFSNFQIARSASSQPPIHLKLQVQDSDFPSPKLRNFQTAKCTPANSAFPTFPNVASAPPKAPSPRFPKTPQAASPCAWTCHRLFALLPHSERNKAPKPPARGAWARLPRAEGTGWRPCRPAGVRGRRCLPCGQKRFRVARRILGVSRERAVCEAVCPSGGLSRRAGERGRRAFRGEHPEAVRSRSAFRARKSPTFFPSCRRFIPPPSRGENGGLCPHPLKGPDP